MGQPEVTYKLSAEDLRNVFRESVSDLNFEKFKMVEVGSQTACDILKISAPTLSHYIERELLRPLNPGSSKYTFCLADVLNCIGAKHKKRNNHVFSV